MPRPAAPLRFRLKAFPPPARIILSGHAATIKLAEVTDRTWELQLSFDSRASYWGITKRFSSPEALSYELTSAWGVEVPDIPVYRVLWETLTRWGLAEKVMNPPARVPFPPEPRYGVPPPR